MRRGQGRSSFREPQVSRTAGPVHAFHEIMSGHGLLPNVCRCGSRRQSLLPQLRRASGRNLGRDACRLAGWRPQHALAVTSLTGQGSDWEGIVRRSDVIKRPADVEMFVVHNVRNVKGAENRGNSTVKNVKAFEIVRRYQLPETFAEGFRMYMSGEGMSNFATWY